MKVRYLSVTFCIKFNSSVEVDNPPLFVIRSVLGKNLRSICCISPQSTCPKCLYRQSCVYVFLFETILSQSNQVVPGRNRASHPFLLSGKMLPMETQLSEYQFTVTLLGKGIEYLPYIYAAFVQAGEQGMFKSRCPFTISDVQVNGKTILLKNNQLDMTGVSQEWNLELSRQDFNGEVLVELRSPLRFKRGGHYGGNFTALDFVKCLERRCQTIVGLYGEDSHELTHLNLNDALKIVDQNLQWLDLGHYSKRQKNVMSLGGVVGTFKLEGTFSAYTQGLLEMGKIFNCGKNTNFGLGQMDYWMR